MITDAARRLSTVQLASIIVTVIVDKVLAAVLVQGYDVILAPTWGGAKTNRAIFCVDHRDSAAACAHDACSKNWMEGPNNISSLQTPVARATWS